MEKKRLMPVIIMGGFFVVSGLLNELIQIKHGRFASFVTVINLACLITGIGLICHKNWARILSFIFSFLALLSLILYIALEVKRINSFYVTFIVFFILLFYYLTRPKVKEQFR